MLSVNTILVRLGSLSPKNLTKNVQPVVNCMLKQNVDSNRRSATVIDNLQSAAPSQDK